ncbi:MAG: chemotaxis protein CheA [Bacteroidales bacterium]|nr:chemotaxis protein CheA [Bacteroidales bacterium]
MIEKYLNEFKNETNGILNLIENDLINLESDSDNSVLIDNIFRNIHTIKGTAAMYGYGSMSVLSHHIETIFEEIRSGSQLVTKEVISLSLDGIDLLKQILQDKATEEASQQLVDKMKELISDKHKESLEMVEKLVQAEGQEVEEKTRFGIVFTPDKNIFDRGVNPTNVIEELEELGDCDITLHNTITSLDEQIEKKELVAWWEIYLTTTHSIEDVQDTFLFNNDDEYKIFEIEGEPGSSLTEFESYIKTVKEKTKEKDDNNQDKSQEPGKPGADQLIAGEVPGKKEEPTHEARSSVNVSSEKLDEMMNIVSDLVTTKAELNLVASELKSKHLNLVVEKIERISKKLRDNALNIRMLPIGVMKTQLKRLVRDLGVQLDKKVEFLYEGLETELDKTIINALESPLIHIIRNSIDHGIESPDVRLSRGKKEEGIVKLTSFYSGSNVYVQVQDDGDGINLDRVKEVAIKKGYLQPGDEPTAKELLYMIIHAGFTTNKNVSMVSGRGVGMDIVYKEISAIRGELEINTERGLGTIITIKLPVTLSIMDTLLVQVSESFFLIPVSDILFVYDEKHAVLFENDSRQLVFKGEQLPFIYLREVFNMSMDINQLQTVLIIRKEEKSFGIVVDKIIGDHQAVLKPLGEMFNKLDYFTGSSILGDGSLTFIIDTEKLYNWQLAGNIYKAAT